MTNRTGADTIPPSLLDDGLERVFEEWAGNPPVEFPDMDKDLVSFWCWKAWKKATEHEREACAKVCEENDALWDKIGGDGGASLECADAIRSRSNAK